MSRAVWRTALWTLRGKQRLAFYYFFTAFYTAQIVGDTYRKRIGFAYALLVAVVAFMWPMTARMVPAPRDLLRLPLSTRDVGTVLFLLRALAPCLCVLLMTPLIAPMFARTPLSPSEQLALAGGLCAAFPLLSLAPFLPLPRSWREPGVTREECSPRLRWLAGGALWLLAPAVAVMPIMSVRNGFTLWPWFSLTIGFGLTLLVWVQRERLASVSVAARPGAAPGATRENGARWHGSSGFVPLLSPLVGTCCALGLATGIFFALPLLPAAATTMVITLVALGVSLSARCIANCARVLRLLPISPARLSVIFLAMLIVPTLTGCLLGATLAHLLHPERLSMTHLAVLCLLSLTCNVVLFVPALRSGRLKSLGRPLAASVVAQVACVLTALYFGIAMPPDAWAFAAALAVLVLCLVWLNTSLKFVRLVPVAAIAITALGVLPVFGAEAPDAAHYAADAEALIEPYVADGRFSGAVLVALHGKPILREGFGLANREWDIAVTPETEFRIGSMTKQFTATAILQLAEQGKLVLGDPIGKYYSAAPKSWNSVTIAQLLSHRSGIPNFTELPGFDENVARRDLTPEQVIALTRDAPLHFAPGSQYEYSNSGYVLLGYVIEKQSGQPYADYLREHVFHPLGMEHTGYDVSADLLPHRASGYRRENDVWKNASFVSMRVPFAAGALYSTVDDL